VVGSVGVGSGGGGGLSGDTCGQGEGV